MHAATQHARRILELDRLGSNYDPEKSQEVSKWAAYTIVFKWDHRRRTHRWLYEMPHPKGKGRLVADWRKAVTAWAEYHSEVKP
jgi:hypothetical protein